MSKKIYLDTYYENPVMTDRRGRWISYAVMGALFPMFMYFTVTWAFVVACVVGPAFSFYGVIRIVVQKSQDKQTVKALEAFVKPRITGSEPTVLLEQSLINAVMRCNDGDRYGEYYGTCEKCKKRFALMITPDVQRYIDDKLEIATENVEKRQKEKLYAEKETEMKLNNEQTQRLVEIFDNPDEIAIVKKSRHTLKALTEIKEDDVKSVSSFPDV